MAKKPQDNEVVIGNGENQRVFGPSTVIQVNLKTLVIVIGLLLSGLTTSYYNLSTKIEKSDEKLSRQISDVDKSLEALKDQDIKEIRSNVDVIRGQLNNSTQQNQNQFRQENIINKVNQSGQVDNMKPVLPK